MYWKAAVPSSTRSTTAVAARGIEPLSVRAPAAASTVDPVPVNVWARLVQRFSVEAPGSGRESQLGDVDAWSWPTEKRVADREDSPRFRRLSLRCD